MWYASQYPLKQEFALENAVISIGCRVFSLEKRFWGIGIWRRVKI